MRESGAEGSEGRAKLRDERHSHIIRDLEGKKRLALWEGTHQHKQLNTLHTEL